MGNLAEWVSALGAIGALIAAIWAAATSGKLFRIESSRDKHASERMEKEQASGIASWCVKIIQKADGDSTAANGIQVHNSTDSPVYYVEVWSTYSVSKDSAPVQKKPLRMDVLPPGDFVSEEHKTYHWGFPNQKEDVKGLVRPITKNSNWRVIEVRFTDSYGVRWARNDVGLWKVSHQPGV
ncbi:hypothetical protein ACU4IU_15940 [Brevibacterium sp. CSND-B09]|uniref:hypothetical protein n=1 Tax=Brevibacterium sp. CSND-B09 TaxID=3462571 RepID=UPI00406A44B8